MGRFLVKHAGFLCLVLSACSSSPPSASPREKISWTQSPANEACEANAEQRAEVPVACSKTCTGSQISIRYCVAGAWQESRLEPTCDCGPDELPSELVECKLFHTTLHRSRNEPSVGCDLELDCGERLSVTCDPEEDGTHTSLCDCERGGKPDHGVQGQLFKDDASACRAAAIVCLAPRAGQGR